MISARHLGSERSGITQGFRGVLLAGRQFAAESAVDSAIDLRAVDPGAALPLASPLRSRTPPTLRPRPFANGLAPSGINGLRQPLELAPVPRPLAWRHFSSRCSAATPRSTPPRSRRSTANWDACSRSWQRSGDDALIAVVSDHGENLGEHGVFYRHSGLFETTTHVPLMIRLPGFRGAAGSRRHGLVQTLDLFPTLLKASGLPIPANDGIDLYELTRSRCDRGPASGVCRRGGGRGSVATDARLALRRARPRRPAGHRKLPLRSARRSARDPQPRRHVAWRSRRTWRGP